LRANPLQSAAGATVTTEVHTPARAARMALIPAERTPSSLVSRTRTLSPPGGAASLAVYG
jgi:CBS-domain-containing membrane protein